MRGFAGRARERRPRARKIVTILFAELIGSIGLQERLDPESVSRVMEAYHAAVRAPVEAHGGSVVQLLGDGVMCAFGAARRRGRCAARSAPASPCRGLSGSSSARAPS